jgi:hypothetical protein
VDIEAWYAQLAGSTFRTVFVPLTPDEARAMAAAYKARPKTWSWEDAEGGASGREQRLRGITAAQRALLAALESKIAAGIDELAAGSLPGGAVIFISAPLCVVCGESQMKFTRADA